MKISIITPTHNPQWIRETWESIKQQGFKDWQWVVLCNSEHAQAIALKVQDIVREEENSRVKIYAENVRGGIGAIKAHAFGLGDGDALLELDHDDLLAPGALQAIADAMDADPDAGFFYSDWIDFEGPKGQGAPETYCTPEARRAWEHNGFTFYERELTAMRKGTYTCVRSFAPSALALSSILWAPNHVRVWRRDVYENLGGHDRRMDIADDHELLVRTYLHTPMHHIPEPLYLYRISGANTWAGRHKEIAKISNETGGKHLETLVLREAELRGMPVYDLGGGINPRKGWVAVDKSIDIDMTKKPEFRAQYYPFDLTKTWPWEDNSVAAFRAFDLLEHLPNQIHTMSEIWRCLMPGGWLLSSTPSTDGRGAFQDPTHVSFWNINSFWYWCRETQARYIRNDEVRFGEMWLYNHMPSNWHRDNKIPYVVAHLVAMKPDYAGPRPNVKK